MTRWPIVALISLAVIVLLSPGIVGHLAKKSLAENMDWLAVENNDIVITAEQFDRGWFSSEGRHRITAKSGSLLEVLTAEPNPHSGSLPSLVIDTRLDHGLVPLASLGREQGSLMPGIARSVSTLKIDAGDGTLLPLPGTIYSNIGLTGNATFHYLMDAGSQVDENALMTWSGADITVHINPRSRSFGAAGIIRPTTLESYGVTTDVGVVTFDITRDRSQYAFGIGAVKLDIDSLTVTSPGEPVAGFGSIRLDAMSELDHERVNGHSSLMLNRVILPGIGTMNLVLDVSAKGLDAGSLNVIVGTLRDVQERALTGTTLPGIPPRVAADVETLVARGLEIHISRFDMLLPDGDLSTTIDVAVPASDEPGSFSWPGVLLATTASVDLAVSTSLYAWAQTMSPEVTRLLAMGVLRRNGDHYEMEARYARGLLTVNGAPMPIPLGMPR